MRHVAAHRWMELLAGRARPTERRKLELHAARCPACAATRDRIARASASFPTLRATSAPELPWDSIRARVHWAVSSGKRASDRSMPTRTWRPWLAIGLAGAATAGAVALIASRTGTPPAMVATTAGAPAVVDAGVAIVAPRPLAPAPLVGLVSRVGGDVMIDGLRGDVFDRRLVAGDVIATGEGRIDIQFGDASAIQLAPRSTLELRRFDAQHVELVVEGIVDIEVGPRAADQRFIVHAGTRDVEVRGTQFRVAHDGASTTVACRHGVVAVREHAAITSAIEVRGAHRVTVPIAKPVGEVPIVALTTDELETLVAATPYTLPVWSDASTLARESAPLELRGTRDLRVDGIEHGVAPVRVRVMPGRHTIEAADREGRFRRLGFVDITPGAVATYTVPALVTLPPTRDLAEAVRQRREQLRVGIDRVRLARCTRAITKSGVAAGSVEVELSVDATGAVGFLNIDSDLPATTAACVRNVLVDVSFGPGATATWRERIDL
ncbi:MAG: FecR family protein [Proteobacteria bacterium]|nr:FecR family protein [Pseudomonadota bacterium]